MMLEAPRKDTDIHPMLLMINQIAMGKTNHGRTLYGRATRHRDVRLCCIGALSFYLAYRIDVTNEFKKLTIEDWQDNSKWFDIKLLAGLDGDNTKEMKNDAYSDHVKRVLKAKNLRHDKLCHLGRGVGSKILDLMEEEEEAKRVMGQWNPTTFDTSYSSKLPLGPMRKLAGFQDKMYFNTRVSIQPSQELLELTPFGGWCFKALAAVEDVCQSTGRQHQTALHVLHFFCVLSTVLLQDASWMIVKHGDRVNFEDQLQQHSFFSLSCFHNDLFRDFVEEMRLAAELEESPLDANLEKVIPGMNRWHATHNSALDALARDLNGFRDHIGEEVKDVKGGLESINHRMHINERERLLSEKRFGQTLLRIVQAYARKDGDNGDNEGLEASLEELTNQSQRSLLQSIPTEATMMTASPTEGEELLIANANEDHEGTYQSYKMIFKHQHLQSLYDEWHGTGEFADSLGGIEGRNKKFGTKWRKHLSQMQYSRSMRIVKAIKNYAEENTMTEAEACEQLQLHYEACNRSPAKFVDWCKSQGMVERSIKPRGRGIKRATMEDDDNSASSN
jgi:hypothetical protein